MAATADDRQPLVILYGGQSPEHEVSCISARHVLAAADPSRYAVRVVGITSDGRWVDAGEAVANLDPGDAALPSPDTLRPVLAPSPPAPRRSALVPLLDTDAGTTAAERPRPVVFPVLHGPLGEDGTVQGLLELAGLAYVGAGHLGSAAAMDKGITKALLAQAGIPQVRSLCVRDHQVDQLLAKHVEVELGWPVFVKPANLGSSIGVSRAADTASLDAAVELACHYDEYVIIEEAIDGREIEVAVLGWPELEVSVPGEIRPTHGVYDFADKYHDGTARLVVPADVADHVVAAIGDMARRACAALRVDAMARVDFFYDEASQRLLLNEVNTIPGFTPISMYPRLWAASGLPYAALIDRLVALAVRRRDRRDRIATTRR